MFQPAHVQPYVELSIAEIRGHFTDHPDITYCQYWLSGYGTPASLVSAYCEFLLHPLFISPIDFSVLEVLLLWTHNGKRIACR